MDLGSSGSVAHASRLAVGKRRCVASRSRVHKQHFRNAPARVPGLLPHGEFGLEFAVLLAFLVYVVRVSLDHSVSAYLGQSLDEDRRVGAAR